jgi:hypothetical protein
MAWSDAEMRAIPTIQSQSKNKQGETQTYTGVPIRRLLETAGVAADATTLVRARHASSRSASRVVLVPCYRTFGPSCRQEGVIEIQVKWSALSARLARRVLSRTPGP